MNARHLLTLAALLAAASLTACGGGGAAGSVPPGGGSSTVGQSLQQQTEDSINTANSVGSPLTDFSDYNDATQSPAQGSLLRTQSIKSDTAGDGSCNNGIEFFAPDKKGDANSTERIDFYDNGCTAVARDAVRLYASTGSDSETVQRTVSFYKMNSPTPAAVRTENVSYANASFDKYGYPVLTAGFDRTHTGQLAVGGTNAIDGDGEIVLAAANGNSSTFCSDSAGFNVTGDAAMNETFGWAGLDPNGTRTANSDGSITWQSTRTGTVYTGAVGSLSIQAGTQNTACPISTPMFTLAGGTVKGSHNIPISATYAHGILSNLTIQNATLNDGDTLNVSTNSGIAPTDEHFISGALANGGAPIANFNVNAFGNGVLVVVSSGKQYDMDDWHVVK